MDLHRLRPGHRRGQNVARALSAGDAGRVGDADHHRGGSALDYAHQRGLLHRDVKPANILIADPGSESQRVFLADFGIARRVDDTGLTTTNMAMGTVAYAARDLDAAVGLWCERMRGHRIENQRDTCPPDKAGIRRRRRTLDSGGPRNCQVPEPRRGGVELRLVAAGCGGHHVGRMDIGCLCLLQQAKCDFHPNRRHRCRRHAGSGRPARSVVSPAQALHGVYHSVTTYTGGGTQYAPQESDYSVDTICLRAGDRCLSRLLRTDGSGHFEMLVFANGSWTHGLGKVVFHQFSSSLTGRR